MASKHGTLTSTTWPVGSHPTEPAEQDRSKPPESIPLFDASQIPDPVILPLYSSGKKGHIDKQFVLAIAVGIVFGGAFIAGGIACINEGTLHGIGDWIFDFVCMAFGAVLVLLALNAIVLLCINGADSNFAFNAKGISVTTDKGTDKLTWNQVEKIGVDIYYNFAQRAVAGVEMANPLDNVTYGGVEKHVDWENQMNVVVVRIQLTEGTKPQNTLKLLEPLAPEQAPFTVCYVFRNRPLSSDRKHWGLDALGSAIQHFSGDRFVGVRILDTGMAGRGKTGVLKDLPLGLG
jgi:hypothetical protein